MELGRLFHPRNFAVIGATPKKQWTWSSGNAWIAGSFRLGFQGAIYPVHPEAEIILGLKAYASLLDIPGEIDLAIVTVPLTSTLQVMKDCVRKGVQFVHILAAGFSETGKKEYVEIEQNLMDTAKKGGVRIIGPNCMGVYCPEGGLSWSETFPTHTGPIGLFSQSGQLAHIIIEKGSQQGLYYSKVISFGNAGDLEAHDFLNYLAQDEKTEIIAAYLEGIKDGRAFFESAKRITSKKPLVIWKGGQTQGGTRAAQSHTAAIAGSQTIWNVMCKQAGIINVQTMEELIFTIRGLQCLSLPKGIKIAVLGGAGGGSVTMTDYAEKEGLQVPHLTDETIRKMEEFVALEGNSIKNPLDILPITVPTGAEKENMIRIAELLRDDSNIDAMIFNASPAWVFDIYGRPTMYQYLKLSIEVMNLFEKPLFIALPKEDDVKKDILLREVRSWYNDYDVPTFPDFRLAARILANMKRYGDYLAYSKSRV
ncbi:MAG: CoA-binding protein [Deltaproteobacteria bacterium]|nr:CoA-binding protein [Deltaproteobacteria bacterium]